MKQIKRQRVVALVQLLALLAIAPPTQPANAQSIPKPVKPPGSEWIEVDRWCAGPAPRPAVCPPGKRGQHWKSVLPRLKRKVEAQVLQWAAVIRQRFAAVFTAKTALDTDPRISNNDQNKKGMDLDSKATEVIVSFFAGFFAKFILTRFFSASKRDLRLYNEFRGLFDKSTFIREVDEVAPGDYYNYSCMETLYIFCREWSAESSKFEDKSIQKKMDKFMVCMMKFQDYYLEHSSIPSGNSSLVKIDADEGASYKERHQVLEKANKLAQEVVDSYQGVLKSCRKLEGRVLLIPWLSQ